MVHYLTVPIFYRPCSCRQRERACINIINNDWDGWKLLDLLEVGVNKGFILRKIRTLWSRIYWFFRVWGSDGLSFFSRSTPLLHWLLDPLEPTRREPRNMIWFDPHWRSTVCLEDFQDPRPKQRTSMITARETSLVPEEKARRILENRPKTACSQNGYNQELLRSWAALPNGLNGLPNGLNWSSQWLVFILMQMRLNGALPNARKRRLDQSKPHEKAVY